MSFKKPTQPAQQSLNLKHVEVLDVLMGSGKTFASLRHIEYGTSKQTSQVGIPALSSCLRLQLVPKRTKKPNTSGTH